MKFNPNCHKRRSNRLIGYDYSQSGLYFITICVLAKECSFGAVSDGIMILNELGEIAKCNLSKIPIKYNQIELHEFIVMPNHVHVIIEILNMDIREIRESPPHETTSVTRDRRRKMLISKVVGWYKMNTSKNINIINNRSGLQFWQRNYYDHIIRNEESYLNISNYIINNPSNWKEDKFYV